MTQSLSVNLNDFRQALRTLAKLVKPKQASEAVLSFADGMLHIDLPGGGAMADAEGTWSGTVRISGAVFLRLAKAIPTDDPLRVSVDGDRLWIGSLSVLCTVDAREAEIIALPLDAPLIAILRVRAMHSDEEIARSGLTLLVRKGEERRDALIARAVAVLEPLEVSEAALRRFIDECVREKFER